MRSVASRVTARRISSRVHQRLKSDAHRARHPLGRVPVLEDGDVSLYESGVIVEHIMARHGDGGLRPAVDAPSSPSTCSGSTTARAW